MFIPDDPGPDPDADMRGSTSARGGVIALGLFALALSIAGALLIFS